MKQSISTHEFILVSKIFLSSFSINLRGKVLRLLCIVLISLSFIKEGIISPEYTVIK